MRIAVSLLLPVRVGNPAAIFKIPPPDISTSVDRAALTSGKADRKGRLSAACPTAMLLDQSWGDGDTHLIIEGCGMLAAQSKCLKKALTDRGDSGAERPHSIVHDRFADGRMPGVPRSE